MSVLAKSLLFGLAFVAALLAVLFGLRRRRLAAASTERGPFPALRKAFWTAAGVLLGTSVGCDDGGTPEPEATCYLPPRDVRSETSFDAEDDVDAETTDADVDLDAPIDYPGCYVAADVPAEDFAELDAEADADVIPDVEPDAGPDAAVDAESEAAPDASDAEAAPDGMDPDAEPVDVAPPDGTGEAAVPDGDPTCYFAGPKMAGDDRRERWKRRTLLRAQAVERLLAEPATHPAVRAILERDLRALRARARRLRED